MRVTDDKAQGPWEGEKRKSVFSFPPSFARKFSLRERRLVQGREPVTGPTPGYAHKENKDNQDRA